MGIIQQFVFNRLYKGIYFFFTGNGCSPFIVRLIGSIVGIADRLGSIRNRNQICYIQCTITGREHTVICECFIQQRLHFCIHGRMNFQTIVINHLICLSGCITQFFLKVYCQLVNHSFHKVVVVGNTSGFFLIGTYQICVYIFRQSFIMLCLGDISQFQHLIQNQCLSLFIVFRLRIRRIQAWIVGNGSNTCAFRQR